MAGRKIQAGEATILLGVKNNVDKGLKAAQASFKKVGAGFTAAGGAITATAGAVAAPLLSMASSFAESGAMLGKLSTQTNVAVSELSSLKFASEQLGIDFEDTAGAIEEFNIRMGETLQDGVGPASDAFKQLGINAEALATLPLADQIGAIGSALNQLPRERRQFLADEIFGGDAFKIMGLLDQGADGIAALGAEAEKLGVVMSSDAAKSAQEYQSAMAKLGATMSSVKNLIGSSVAPIITDIVERFIEATSGIRAWIKENRAMFGVIFKAALGVGAFGIALVGIGGTFAALSVVVGGLATAFSVFAAAIGFLLSPIGLVIAAVVALGVAIWKYTDWASQAIDWLVDRFGPLVETVKSSVSAIREAFATGDISKAWDIIVDTMEMTWLDLTNGIRRYWDSAMNWITDVTVAAAKAIASVFEALGRGIQKMLDGYKSYYDSVYNSVVTNLGELTGVRTIGGSTSAFSSNFGGIENAISSAASGIEQFGKNMSDAAQAEGDARKAARMAAQRERDERLKSLRASLKAEGEAADKAREERKMSKPELDKLREDALGQMLAQQPAGGQSAAGTFSSAAALFMGGSSLVMRNTRANENTADNTAVIADEAKKEKVATFGA